MSVELYKLAEQHISGMLRDGLVTLKPMPADGSVPMGPIEFTYLYVFNAKGAQR